MSDKQMSLKSLVKEKGLRTDYLAKRVGLQPGSLRAILNGTRKPSAAVVKLLALELGVAEDGIRQAS